MPAVARLYADGDRRAVQRILTISARVVLVASVVVGLVLAVFAAPFLSLFGGDFEGGVTALRILAIGELSNAVAGFAGLALLMSGHESTMTYGTAAGSVVNVVVASALIPSLGVNGAAIGMACGMIVWNALFALLLWKKTGLYAPGIRFRPARA